MKEKSLEGLISSYSTECKNADKPKDLKTFKILFMLITFVSCSKTTCFSSQLIVETLAPAK